MGTAADIETLMNEASTAIGTGDWSTVKTKALQAKAKLSGQPDANHQGGGYTWNRESIDSLIDQAQKEINTSATSSGPIRQPMEKVRPTG
ncbi:MAG: hypothetical protein ACYTEQ_01420 [Planctomycetota bacterium]|jgi:hypothetical protein